MLELSNVSIAYGRKVVLCALTHRFAAGVHALTGPNGCGKTTFLLCASGTMAPSSGRVLVDGDDLYRESVTPKMKLSYMPDKPYVFPSMTGRDLLDLVSKAKGVAEQDVRPHIEQFKLSQYLDASFSSMSLGTQRKFTFIAALIGDPKVILLDEPTNAMDQETCEQMSAIITALATDHTIVMTTHSAVLMRALNASQVSLVAQRSSCKIESAPSEEPGSPAFD